MLFRLSCKVTNAQQRAPLIGLPVARAPWLVVDPPMRERHCLVSNGAGYVAMVLTAFGLSRVHSMAPGTCALLRLRISTAGHTQLVMITATQGIRGVQTLASHLPPSLSSIATIRVFRNTFPAVPAKPGLCNYASRAGQPPLPDSYPPLLPTTPPALLSHPSTPQPAINHRVATSSVRTRVTPQPAARG